MQPLLLTPPDPENSSSDAETIPTCHIVPCSIKYTGPAAVNTYFRPERGAVPTGDGTESTDCYIAYLRGRRLYGREISVPGYQAMVVNPTDQTVHIEPLNKESGFSVETEDPEVSRDPRDDPFAEPNQATDCATVAVEPLEVKTSLERIILWGHEFLPGDSDPWRIGTSEWLKVAEAVSLYEWEFHFQEAETN